MPRVKYANRLRSVCILYSWETALPLRLVSGHQAAYDRGGLRNGIKKRQQARGHIVAGEKWDQKTSSSTEAKAVRERNKVSEMW